jgi:hypothetical protein
MTVGTRSVLFGVHNIFIHALFLGAAWWKLFGPPRDPRLWVAFLVHDIGYIGKSSVEGPIGETHVELGARIMQALFGASWGNFCRRHSRYYARSRGLRISRLCVADKLAFVLTPPWLYLPMARASGELAEYMERSKERQAGSEYFTPEESVLLTSTNPRDWLKGLQSYTYRWVLKNRDADGDPWNLGYHDRVAFIERPPFQRTEVTAAKPAATTYHFRRLGNSSTQILRDGFDPLPFRQELVGAQASHFEWGYGGTGPEVTAACVLADFLEDDRLAVEFCGAFKALVIGKLPRADTWVTGAEILAALESCQGRWAAAGHRSW